MTDETDFLDVPQQEEQRMIIQHSKEADAFWMVVIRNEKNEVTQFDMCNSG